MISIIKNIVITLLVALLLFFSVAYGKSDPVDVFAELDGTWEGTFIGYDHTGNELYRIKVKQTYHTINETTQKVLIKDTYPTGEIVTGEGENIAIRESDGTISLKCIVRKSNGKLVQHKGHLVLGPTGKKQLIWYSKEQNICEIFRESIENHVDGIFYEINGMGIYEDDSVLMAGSYRKQAK